MNDFKFFFYRKFHKIEDWTKLEKLSLAESPSSSKTYACDRKGCKDAPAVSFCVECDHKLCDTHLQVTILH